MNTIALGDGIVRFCYQDNTGIGQVCTLSGGDFPWLLPKHVLTCPFPRARDCGLFNANVKDLRLHGLRTANQASDRMLDGLRFEAAIERSPSPGRNELKKNQ